jgi:sugar lactone lactonase YvrE
MSNTSKPQLLLTGLTFGESPRWHAGRLWVSDWGTRELIAVSQGGKSEVMVKLDFPSFQSSCKAPHWVGSGEGMLPRSRVRIVVLLSSTPYRSWVRKYRWNREVPYMHVTEFQHR